MVTPDKFRTIVFAFGNVGRDIVDFIRSEHRNALVAVVVDRDQEPAAFAGFCDRLGSDLVVPWDRAKQPDGAEALRRLGADVAILAWWPHLLRAPILEAVARSAVLNLHPSLLPHCRGKDPYFWSIVERRPFGVTIHHVVNAVDAGDIAFQQELPVDWQDTAETLYRRAQSAMVQLFKNNYPRVSRCDIPRLPQRLPMGSFHVRKELDSASTINLEARYTGRELLDLLRARTFSPHPGCRFVDGGETYQVRVSITRVSEES